MRFLAIILCLIPAVALAGVIADGTATVTTTAQTLSDMGVTVGDDAKTATIQAETGAVRVGFETAVTSSTGLKLDAGDTIYLDNYRDITNVSFIQDDGASAATINYVISGD
jgi:co-chaperonin GroES (HSP10)